MNIPRQMINLLGIVVVVALLVAGLTMVVLPMYSSARAIDSDTANVAQTNQQYDVRVARLTAAQAEIETLTGDVTALRRQIAASSQLDDVMQIVVDSARVTGATIESVVAADAEPWAPRTGLEGDEDAGLRVLFRALEMPCRLIAENAGQDGTVVVSHILKAKDKNHGYNADTDEYEDLRKAGVIDPVKVTRSALRNAASIASMVLTTDTLVVEKKEEEPEAAGGHGHGHGH